MTSLKAAGAKVLASLVAGAAAGATLLLPTVAHASGTTAGAQTAAAAVSDRLLPGQYLKPGQYIRSRNGIYTLLMQGDGNAVLYKGRTALWATYTNRKASSLIMQKTGNLVVVSGRTVVWSSNTAGSTNSTLAVQNDSNLVMYNSRGKAFWSRAMVIGTLGSNRVMKAGQALFSVNRIYRMTMQTDGNLVLTKNNKTVLWHTATGKNPGAFVAMQADGNLVVYSAAKRALWSSRTAPRAGSVLQVLNTGNAVIVHGRTTVWQTGTAGR